eukprot:Opistho-2@86534
MASVSGFRFHHTMLRVKDPVKSLDFYTRHMGMKLVGQRDFPDMKFSLYFLAHTNETCPEGIDVFEWLFSRDIHHLELTHNHGTESDNSTYHNGNSDPRGFGHIAFRVEDLYKACDALEKDGVNVRRKPGPMGGSINHIAFVEDPDKYWVELIQDVRWGKQ